MAKRFLIPLAPVPPAVRAIAENAIAGAGYEIRNTARGSYTSRDAVAHDEPTAAKIQAIRDGIALAYYAGADTAPRSSYWTRDND